MNSESRWGAVGENFESSEGGRAIRKKVAILGHSFVRDLTLPGTYPLGDSETEVIVLRKFCVPGATTVSIKSGRTWERFKQFQPDLTFLID